MFHGNVIFLHLLNNIVVAYYRYESELGINYKCEKEYIDLNFWFEIINIFPFSLHVYNM